MTTVLHLCGNHLHSKVTKTSSFFSAFVLIQKSCLKFCCPAGRFITTIIIGPILKKQNQSGCIFN